jgi:hypothetical protein
MTKRKKQGLILLALSVPMMWWGFTNFMSGTTNSTALAMGIALSCTLGSLFAISGLVMLATKNSLGIWNPDDKNKDRGVVLASQANVGDSLVENLSTADKIRQRNEAAIDNLVTKTTDNAIKTLTKKQKVKPMVKTKDANINKSVEEIRGLEESLVQSEEIIKKETLNAKATTEKIAVLKHNLAKDKAVKELLAIVTDYQLKQ